MFCLTPDVGGETFLRFHFLEVGLSLLLRHLTFGLDDVEKDVADVAGHRSRVSANVEVTVVLADDLPQLFGVPLQQMRHVNLLLLIPGEGAVHLDHTLPVVLAQLLLVNEVFGAFPAAEIEDGFADAFALLLREIPVLDEPSEGREPCARSDHDDRRLRFSRKPELRFPYEDRHSGKFASR